MTDSTVDKEGLDWLLTYKPKSEINDLFTDLIQQRVRKVADSANLANLIKGSDNRLLQHAIKAEAHINDQT